MVDCSKYQNQKSFKSTQEQAGELGKCSQAKNRAGLRGTKKDKKPRI